MTLIKSISGIRGTIGGKPGEGLSPLDLVKFTAAYAQWLKTKNRKNRLTVVVGRDARISGEMVNAVVTGTLSGMGIHVTDLGLATTPTVEIAVTEKKADGGIILTASHNPVQWNALKLLNGKGEFISAADGTEILGIAGQGDFDFAGAENLGKVHRSDRYDDLHIRKILELPLVDTEAIRKASFRIVVDCVNSVGGKVIPKLLSALGVQEVVELFCTPDGRFPHNPEPLPEHLHDISAAVKQEKAHLGFAVDPDVDRLAIISEDGSMFGEEYTLVSVADYVLRYTPGNTVSNLSSTAALRDVTERYGGKYYTSAVGEVNVVAAMKECNAVIGGEGNGGVIYPDLHYGRDALVGIALFLSHLAKAGTSCSELRAVYPDYYISKNKIELNPGIDVDGILKDIAKKNAGNPVNTTDGVRIEFGNEWVHLRKSNTEPIIRIYSESTTKEKANRLAGKFIRQIKDAVDA
ncbi:MAG: phosphoglucosamine mutase [Bacteroidetes bacterium]|nr:phosphoglucosamine mutase [Bacteroidota bacterium]